ncbi:MAG: hypothetical protein QOG15_339 [Solirubrobacteraceae bacterium]|jgi:hypothetical protein|nr:hypothetical protein [Solirubrobacteraceae bacterium]
MRKRVLTVVGVAALAAAGCGGDSTPDHARPALTKAQYIAKADAICVATKRATRKYKRKTRALSPTAPITALAPILRAGTPEIKKGLDRLRALPAPKEERATLLAFYASRAKTIAIANQVADAAAKNATATATKLIDQSDKLTHEQARLGRAYGFQHCGGRG